MNRFKSNDFPNEEQIQELVKKVALLIYGKEFIGKGAVNRKIYVDYFDSYNDINYRVAFFAVEGSPAKLFGTVSKSIMDTCYVLNVSDTHGLTKSFFITYKLKHYKMRYVSGS